MTWKRNLLQIAWLLVMVLASASLSAAASKLTIWPSNPKQLKNSV